MLRKRKKKAAASAKVDASNFTLSIYPEAFILKDRRKQVRYKSATMPAMPIPSM